MLSLLSFITDWFRIVCDLFVGNEKVSEDIFSFMIGKNTPFMLSPFFLGIHL